MNFSILRDSEFDCELYGNDKKALEVFKFVARRLLKNNKKVANYCELVKTSSKCTNAA